MEPLMARTRAQTEAWLKMPVGLLPDKDLAEQILMFQTLKSRQPDMEGIDEHLILLRNEALFRDGDLKEHE